MGQRGKQDWSREELPIGTIRVRRHSARSRVRMVKVRNDGPKGRRWIALARHWWIQNKGPIPAGMRVVHRNGDHLDDRPENYVLCSGGDVAYLARVWDPDVEARCEARRLPAIREHNRLRSRVRRAAGYLADRWYAVDPESRRVINDPQRERAGILRAWLGASAGTLNGAGYFGAWLGWPGIADLGAFLLAAAVDGPLTFPELVRRVTAHRALFGLPAPEKVGTFFSANSRLRRAGLLDVLRQPGAYGRQYQASAAALAARVRPCPWIPCRGQDLAERFPGYRRGVPSAGALRRAAKRNMRKQVCKTAMI